MVDSQHGRNDRGYEFMPIKSDESFALDLLVVEDDSDTSSLIQMALLAWGLPLNVEFVNDGFEALRHLMRKKPQILILDLRLPLVDGFTILNAVRDAGDNYPILLVTGITQSDIEILGDIPENVFYVQKPIDLIRLKKLLLELIGIELGK